MNDVSDNIYDEDYPFLEEDKIDNHYYIGLTSKDLLLLSTVSPKTFYKYDYHLVQQYLNDYSVNESSVNESSVNESSVNEISVNESNFRNIEIIKLDIQNNVYYVILKTYWIRLIQRRWKKIFQNRLNYRKRLDSIFYFQTYGKYKKIPSLPIKGLINY